MQVVIAPDKFKGSLSAVEAARAMAEGVRDWDAGVDTVICPMADGGEGTVEAVASATGSKVIETQVSGPLPGQTVPARWTVLDPGLVDAIAERSATGGILSPGRRTAVIEMAQASGLSLVPPERRDPAVTTTRGTGELIAAALDDGCRQIVVGIGGSGTVDGGTGMACALGYRFLDEGGREVPPGGGNLERIASIDATGRHPRLGEAEFVVASDVQNPLVGPGGAAAVYGPQKGATREQVGLLEKGLTRLGRVIEEQLGVSVFDEPGAGAAGGLGAGLLAFCGARITSGVKLVASMVGLEERLKGADLVLTGEGSFDEQSSYGKAASGVVEMALGAGVPAVIVAGRLSAGTGASPGPGAAAYCVVPGPMCLEEAMERAGEIVRSGTARLMRLLALRPGSAR